MSGKAVPDDGKLFSLSPWERVGVRASGRTVPFSRMAAQAPYPGYQTRCSPVSAAPSGKIPDDGKLFSLSPWERVGVRASGRTAPFSRYD
ncbi:hypothetical protein [Kluyvera intermedia]|uniref:hypothetical protein n=1 Tax=Kluyvera intermedia TaxID=61648 RepID=UPI00111C0628|nr:hypothetical protein [Kluyvera intermedia]